MNEQEESKIVYPGVQCIIKSLKSISPSTKLFRIKAGCTYLFNPSRCLESNDIYIDDIYIDVYFGLCHSDCDGEKTELQMGCGLVWMVVAE